MATLASIHRHLHKASRIVAAAGGLGIIFISVMTTVDITLRKFFEMTLGGANEIAGMVFAVATAASYTYVLVDRANIRIDVIYTHLKPNRRALLDLAALTVYFLFLLLLTRSIYMVVEKSWSGNTLSVGVVNIPLWIPQFLWFLGFAFATLSAAFLLGLTINCMVRKDWAGANLVSGIPTIDEIIEEETHLGSEELIGGGSTDGTKGDE